MMLIKFELKKIFYNRFFLVMLIFTLFLNLFTLYESSKTARFDESKMLYNTYDEFVDSVQSNAEKSLSASIFSDELSDFSKKNIEKTAKDFEKMRGIEISQDINVGVLLVLNSENSDICILLILISLGLSLIVDEKEKRLFQLIRSTTHGTISTILSKLSALLICCVLINVIITASTVGFTYAKYGFGDVFRSIQSIPEMLTVFFRFNILQFFLMLFATKTIGIFIIAVFVILLCLLSKRAITMLVFVVLISSASISMTFIPETSEFIFFKYINLYSLLNPYKVFSSYINLNILGKPINVNVVFAFFLITMLLLSMTLVVFYFIKKRPLENCDKKNNNTFLHGRIWHSIIHFEFKKILSLNKVIVIILFFALFQTYNVYNQENFQSADEYYYQYYMEMLSGPLTSSKEKLLLSEKKKIDEAEEQIYILNEQRHKNELTLQEFIQKQEQYSDVLNKASMFNRVYEKYIYIKNNPGAEFIYDTGYEKLFGISEQNFSLNNSLLLLFVFALCFCSIYSVDYKTNAFRILCTTKYGIDKTRKVKTKVIVFLSIFIFLIAYIPEAIYIGRFYGFPNLIGQLLCIPELSNLGSLPIWFGIAILYVIRLLIVFLLIPIISAISLKSKNNIITAIIFSLIFVLPNVICAFFNVELMLYFSLWNLLSGSWLFNGSSICIYVFQFIMLTTVSYICNRFVSRRFGTTI